jgi:hypothetical protein
MPTYYLCTSWVFFGNEYSSCYYGTMSSDIFSLVLFLCLFYSAFYKKRNASSLLCFLRCITETRCLEEQLLTSLWQFSPLNATVPHHFQRIDVSEFSISDNEMFRCPFHPTSSCACTPRLYLSSCWHLLQMVHFLFFSYLYLYEASIVTRIRS